MLTSGSDVKLTQHTFSSCNVGFRRPRLRSENAPKASSSGHHRVVRCTSKGESDDVVSVHTIWSLVRCARPPHHSLIRPSQPLALPCELTEWKSARQRPFPQQSAGSPGPRHCCSFTVMLSRSPNLQSIRDELDAAANKQRKREQTPLTTASRGGGRQAPTRAKENTALRCALVKTGELRRADVCGH